jgi:arylsulfatase A
MSEIDVLPTLVKLAGGEVPADHKIDGKDIWPQMSGQSKVSPHEALFYFNANRLEAVRSGPWKLTIVARGEGKAKPAAKPAAKAAANPGAKKGQKAKAAPPAAAPVAKQPVTPTLYNLDADIGEQNDVAAQHPEIVSKLQEYVKQMDADLGASGIGPGVRAPGRVDNPQPLLKRTATEYD